MKKNVLFVILSLGFTIISCEKNDFNEELSNPAVSQLIASSSNEDLILVTPIRTGTSYLINRSGFPVQEWSNDSSVLMAYLMDDGSLIRTVFTGLENGINIPGKTGKIEIIDPQGNTTWEWTLDNPQETLHHDIALLPNGNILATVWEVMDSSTALLEGKDPNQLFDNRVLMEKVIEIKPVGTNEAIIIWEWNSKDHLVQNFDVSKNNYDVVETRPELINFNYSFGSENMFHINSIDYNEALDQIILSTRLFNELWVIDHSTNTLEATTSIGGIQNKGGDLLFRYGNPNAFNSGSLNDQKFFLQHDASLTYNEVLNEASFYVFNNAGPETSIVQQKIVSTSLTGGYPDILSIADEDIDWEYEQADIYSKLTSGVQKLTNGNLLITSTASGLIREINSSGATVWEYDINREQEDFFQLQSNGFKNRNYSKDHPGVLNLHLN